MKITAPLAAPMGNPRFTPRACLMDRLGVLFRYSGCGEMDTSARRARIGNMTSIFQVVTGCADCEVCVAGSDK